MATVQDYLNMAVSMTIGNKSGTDNQVLLPDDFRKFENLRVKEFRAAKAVVAADETGQNVNRSDADDSFTLVFFSHPVLVTHINGTDTNDMKTSFMSFGRNLEGSAGFNPVLLTFSHTLEAPTFTAVAGSAATMAEVELFIINIRLAA